MVHLEVEVGMEAVREWESGGITAENGMFS
jgi:hypothetical protein